MDSGFKFWLVELGFWIQIVNRIGIPRAIFFPDSGFQMKKFPESGSLYMGKNGQVHRTSMFTFLLDH